MKTYLITAALIAAYAAADNADKLPPAAGYAILIGLITICIAALITIGRKGR